MRESHDPHRYSIRAISNEQRSFFFRTTTATLRIDETEFEIHLEVEEEDRGSDPRDLHGGGESVRN